MEIFAAMGTFMSEGRKVSESRASGYITPGRWEGKGRGKGFKNSSGTTQLALRRTVSNTHFFLS